MMMKIERELLFLLNVLLDDHLHTDTHTYTCKKGVMKCPFCSGTVSFSLDGSVGVLMMSIHFFQNLEGGIP
jgi:hypothetical protein